MSEQKTFMQQLDEWTDATVIMPLIDPESEENFDPVAEKVKKAIREKVLESYRNGQAAGGKAPARNFGARENQPGNAYLK